MEDDTDCERCCFETVLVILEEIGESTTAEDTEIADAIHCYRVETPWVDWYVVTLDIVALMSGKANTRTEVVTEFAFNADRETVLLSFVLELEHYRNTPADVCETRARVVLITAWSGPWSDEHIAVVIDLEYSLICSLVAVPTQAQRHLKTDGAACVPMLYASEVETKLKAVCYLLFEAFCIGKSGIREPNVLWAEIGIDACHWSVYPIIVLPAVTACIG